MDKEIERKYLKEIQELKTKVSQLTEDCDRLFISLNEANSKLNDCKGVLERTRQLVASKDELLNHYRGIVRNL